MHINTRAAAVTVAIGFLLVLLWSVAGSAGRDAAPNPGLSAAIRRLPEVLGSSPGSACAAGAPGWPGADALAATAGSRSPQAAVPASILIDAVYPQTYGGIYDEAFRLTNVATSTIDMADWSLTEGEGTVAFPSGVSLSPGQSVWCARQATAFYASFGFLPDYEWSGDSEDVPDLAYSGSLRFNDDGDAVVLLDADGETADVLVYKAGTSPSAGWAGSAVQPYTPSSSFPERSQIFYRKRDPTTGLPVPDSDTAADWAQDSADPIEGRRVQYPGWDLDAFFTPQIVTETAVLTVAVSPDNLYTTVAPLLTHARETIQIECYSFRSRELADILLARLSDGVSITLLLEGAPAVEGVTDEEKWIAGELSAAGAQVLFMINDPDQDVHSRYPYVHAKFLIVDGRLVLVGSENLNPTGMPADPAHNGTAGRRGVYLITDAPGVVARAQAVFAADADPEHHTDIATCAQVPDLCTPPAGFEPPLTPDWISYTVQFPTPLATAGSLAFEVLQSPENSLRAGDGLLGLLSRAGPGDEVLVEEFYENLHWGPDTGTPDSDPNPRLQALLDAARRGAKVRILLDAFLDSEGENAETVAYLRQVALAEPLDLQARLANPTSLGLHNKMVLARIGGRGYVHAGSINGNETSSKVNRELALQVQSDAAYSYLQAVFDYDWNTAAPPLFLPLVFRGNTQAPPAVHALIAEAYYAVAPEEEWVEIYNPTEQPIDFSSYKLGDAAYPQDYEGMVQFPPGTSLGPRLALVVVSTASGFRQNFPGESPDFEIFDSDPAVPDMLKYTNWGAGDWGLNNAGDEVILLDPNDAPVDVLVYGTGAYPGVTPHPGGIAYNHSLQRYPPWADTDDCSADFRDWPYPTPGESP